MKTNRTAFTIPAAALLLLAFSMSALIAAEPREPVRLIFDTDMGNDVDDAMALAVIHALETRGQVKLLAVTLTKDHPLAAEFVDAINTFYGRGDIPIGAVRNGAARDQGKFIGLAAEKRDGRQRFPHDLAGGEKVPEATALLRDVLAAQPDGSVIIAQVGFSTNLARLLASGPDSHSPLSGAELVRRKVKLLSMMAGSFRPIGGRTRHLEYNVVEDIPSAKKVIDHWPAPIVISGFEIGIAIRYPHESIDRDYAYVPDHPITAAYRAYCAPGEDRPTWDLTSVLHAALPDAGYFALSPPGRIIVRDDGYTLFEETKDGAHRYLIAEDPHIVRTREALVQLSSQPPGGE